MRVYQQVLDMGADVVELLEDLLGADLDEACALFSRRGLRSAAKAPERGARNRGARP